MSPDNRRGVPDEIRERVAEEIQDLFGHSGTTPEHFHFAADAMLAVLDRDALMAMLGAERVGWDNPQSWPRPWVRLSGVSPATEATAVYRFPAQEDR